MPIDSDFGFIENKINKNEKIHNPAKYVVIMECRVRNKFEIFSLNKFLCPEKKNIPEDEDDTPKIIIPVYDFKSFYSKFHSREVGIS